MPVSVAKKLESMRSAFFWGGVEGNRKMAWIKWDHVQASKEKCGLDLGSIVSFNVALMLKWKWRFFNYGGLVWVQVINSLYGNKGGFGGFKKVASGDSPWARLIALDKKLDASGVIRQNVLRWKVRSGHDTLFWLDNWVGENTLAEVYPRRQLEGGVSAAQMEELVFKLVNEKCIDGQDYWQWGINSDGQYTVSSTRQWIDDKVLPTVGRATRWCSWVLKKVKIFVWRVLWNRLPTRDLLISRGINVDSDLCPLCNIENESVNHVLGSYEVASSIWRLVLRWLQIHATMSLGPENVFQWLDEVKVHKDKKKVIEVIVCTTLWAIWRLRNDSVHEVRVLRKNLLFDFIQEFSFCWCNSRQNKFRILWVNWLQHPLLAL
ncbi:hypothetical protein LXL04_012575 [Taraxacum kok-saghyz]